MHAQFPRTEHPQPRGADRSFRWMTAAAALTVAPVLVAGCAQFDDSQSAPFSPVAGPGENFGDAPEPNTPPDMGQREPSPGQGEPPDLPPQTPEGRQECEDPDPAVIATCLEPTNAVVGLPDSAEAIIAERDTGEMFLVSDAEAPKPFARIDPGQGAVVSLALSPSYAQDRLVYAVLVSGGVTKVARIAEGDEAKIVADGLPSSENGRAGIAFNDDEMLVGVGREVLGFPEFDGIGEAGPTTTVASTESPIIDLCAGPGIFPGVYATTGGTAGGALMRVDEGAALRVWSWPDQPSVDGCAVTTTGPAVAIPDAERVDMVVVDPASGIAPAPPTAVAEGQYGRLAGVGLMAGNALVGTTTNKAGGSPVPTDDRAIILPISGSSADERT